MKIIAAAIALIAVPALAQTAGQQTPRPQQQGAMGAGQTSSGQSDTRAQPTTTQAEPSTQLSTSTAPSNGPRARRAQTASGNNAAAQLGGGLAPSQPALQGTPQPGATVQFVPAPPPAQAFPAPAPLDSYPLCKKGQYDKCREPGSAATGERRRRRR